MTRTKYGRLEITWPAFDHDLINALEDTNFVNNVVRMEKKIRGSMITTGYTNTQEEKETHQTEKNVRKQSQNTTNRTSRITHNNQNTLDCSRSLITVATNAHLTRLTVSRFNHLNEQLHSQSAAAASSVVAETFYDPTNETKAGRAHSNNGQC